MTAVITIKIENIDDWDEFNDSGQPEIEAELREELKFNPLPFHHDELEITFE